MFLHYDFFTIFYQQGVKYVIMQRSKCKEMHLITFRTLITNIARELLVGSALQILSSSEFMAPSSDSEAAYQPQTIKITPLCLTAVSAFVNCFLFLFYKIQVDQTF